MAESEAMTEIAVSSTAQLGYCLTGIVYLLLPPAAYYILRRYGAARLLPVIAGAVMYFIATRLADLTVWLALGSASFAVKAAAAAELVPFTEEPARYFAVRYPLTGINSAGTALCYGIGHGGLECLFRAVDSFRSIGILDKLTAQASGENAVQVTDSLRQMAEYSFPLSIAASVSLIMSFCLHLALSLLIYRKLHDQKPVKWLFIAIGIHYANNVLGWLVSFVAVRAVMYIFSSLLTLSLILLTIKLIGGREVLEEIRSQQYE